MAWLSHTTVPSSSIAGTRRLGLRAQNSSVSRPPKAPPASIRSCARPSSPTAHMTFCTLMEFLRPQIFSMSLSRPVGRDAQDGGVFVFGDPDRAVVGDGEPDRRAHRALMGDLV